MEKIYIIGDVDTVSAFRLAGVEGVVADSSRAAAALERIVGKKDAGIVLITGALASGLRERISEINLGRPSPVVVEIPGMDDPEGFRGSVMAYVEEALGISL